MMRMQSLVAAGLALPLYCNNNKLLWNLHLIYNSQYLGCAVPVDVRQSDGDGVIRLHLQHCKCPIKLLRTIYNR